MFRFFAAIVAVIALSGCAGTSSADPDAKATTPAPDVTAATGAKITGTGYMYNVPDGWDTPPEPIPGFDPDSIAVDLTDDDGFSDNVNVLSIPAEGATLDDVEADGKKGLEATGAKDVTVHDRASIDGSKAAHLVGNQSMGDNKYTTDQFYVIRNEDAFVITFSFSANVSKADRAKVTGPVLASWTWTD